MKVDNEIRRAAAQALMKAIVEINAKYPHRGGKDAMTLAMIDACGMSVAVIEDAVRKVDVARDLIAAFVAAAGLSAVVLGNYPTRRDDPGRN
jgi:hypothetical protein